VAKNKASWVASSERRTPYTSVRLSRGQVGLKIRNGKGSNNEGVKWDPMWQGVGEGWTWRCRLFCTEKGLLISSPSPHKVYLPSGFVTSNQAVSCWTCSWPVGSPEAQSLTPIILNLKNTHPNPSLFYLSIANSCIST
jgi:hypothetical protein